RAPRVRGGLRRGRGLRGRGGRAGVPHPALSAGERTRAVRHLVQYRDHRGHGPPAPPLRGGHPRLRPRVHRCGVSLALAEGARELWPPHRHPALPAGWSFRPHGLVSLVKLLVLLALAVLAALPWVVGSYLVTVMIFIFFYAYLGQAWNIVGGYAGQLSAGHAAFVGVGAYASALLSVEAGLTPWIGMFLGGALAALLGAVIGFLGFRFGLRGFYFVLLAVAFAEICRIVALNTNAVGGALGYYITFTGDPRQFQFQQNWAYYYVALGLMLGATLIVSWIERLRFGQYLVAIRQDESASEA